MISYLLDCSNISDNQKLMIKTAVGTGNKWKFDAVAQRLNEHHVRIHLSERATQSTTKHAHSGKFRSWAPRTAFRRQSHVAHLGVAQDEEVNDEASTVPDDNEPDAEDACYMCTS